MDRSNLSFIKNKNLLKYSPNEPYAFATYRINSSKYNQSIIEEIAIGQSLGAWETSRVSEEILKNKVAKIVKYEEYENYFDTQIAFPYNLWHGNLSWLLTLMFGKMSFYPGIQLNSVKFSDNCFSIPSYDSKSKLLTGPKNSLVNIRKQLSLSEKSPLLMGILKPNVAMSAKQICELYVEAADAGIHLLKDDEIRFDENEAEIIKRVELVAREKQNKNLKALYAVHLQISGNNYLELIKNLEAAGADAFLINSWICGIDILQNLRQATNLPIFSHPALVGAFGFEENQCTIHPRVTLAQILRAAGADFTLFPSPYGKLGLPKPIALDIAHECLTTDGTSLLPMTPVPSAGIKPEHAPIAMEDFGTDFVLNAGTGIFSGEKSIKENIHEFKKYL